MSGKSCKCNAMELISDFRLPQGMSVFDDSYNIHKLMALGFTEMPNIDLKGTVPIPSLNEILCKMPVNKSASKNEEDEGQKTIECENEEIKNNDSKS